MIELQSGDTTALIDPKGGYVASLRNKQGFVLFPRKMYTDENGSQKVRGGQHVCMPNFGPGGDSGLPQHGYGRITHWRPVFEEEDSVFLVIDTGPDAYKKVRTELHYSVTDTSIDMALLAYNYGDTVVRFAPAFHPYFDLGDSKSVRLNGKSLDLDALADTKFIDGTRQTLEIGDSVLTLESSELQRWAIWTDRLGKYVCVEPTLAGYAFLEQPDDNQLIRGGVTRIYSLTISWQDR